MGMFDRVYVNCWRCGERIELQSKSGDCILAEYTLNDVPADVIGGLAGDEGNCKKCGAGYKVVVRVSAWLSPTPDAPDLGESVPFYAESKPAPKRVI